MVCYSMPWAAKGIALLASKSAVAVLDESAGLLLLLEQCLPV